MNKAKRFLRSPVFTVLFCLILGGIFIYASIDKIVNPENFAKMIYNYQILPLALVNLAAITMPWVELLCGVSIVTWIFRRGSAALISILLVVFMVAITIAIAKGLNIECGCFSVSGKGRAVGFGILVEDGIMLLLALRVLLWK